MSKKKSNTKINSKIENKFGFYICYTLKTQI